MLDLILTTKVYRGLDSNPGLLHARHTPPLQTNSYSPSIYCHIKRFQFWHWCIHLWNLIKGSSGNCIHPCFFLYGKKQNKRHSRKPQWTSILCPLMYMNNTSNCNTDYIGFTRIINQYIHYLITGIFSSTVPFFVLNSISFLLDWLNYNNDRLAARLTIV